LYQPKTPGRKSLGLFSPVVSNLRRLEFMTRRLAINAKSIASVEGSEHHELEKKVRSILSAQGLRAGHTLKKLGLA
jgi:hypothetical protein